jgi:GT2 family glycosyltransferase
MNNLQIEVSIVIVNYNGVSYLEKLFNSIQNLNTEISYEVVIVDNGSKDDSISFLQKLQLKIPCVIVASLKNLGFAGGNNLGVKNAAGKYIVFLNNDTVIVPDWLDKIYYAIFNKNDIGIVGSKLVFFYDFIEINIPNSDTCEINIECEIANKHYKIEQKFCRNGINFDKKITFLNSGKIYLPILAMNDTLEFRLFVNTIGVGYFLIGDQKFTIKHGENYFCLPKAFVLDFKKTLLQNAGSGVNEYYDGFDIGFGEIDQGQYDYDYETQNACGAAMIMKKSDFESIDGFYENFFMYYEDTDLSFRVRKLLNKKIMYCHDAVVRHIHTGSSKEWSAFFTFYVIKNKMLFVKRNISYKLYVKIWVQECRRLIKDTLKKNVNYQYFKARLKALLFVIWQ